MVVILLILSLGHSYWQAIEFIISSWYTYAVLISLTFALYFHLCNGIRHLLWDTGRYLEKESLKRTSLMVLLSSIFLTIVTWLIRFYV